MQDGRIIWSPGWGVICELSEPHPESGLLEHNPVDLGSSDWDEAMGNGNLIITVHELLEACKMARRYMTDDAARDDMSDAGFAYYDDVCDALRDAIAKAEGEDIC
jgi:hypothetical protein